MDAFDQYIQRLQQRHQLIHDHYIQNALSRDAGRRGGDEVEETEVPLPPGLGLSSLHLDPPTEEHKDHLEDLIKIEDAKFKIACQQIIKLNDKVDQVEARYQRAVASGRHSFRYVLRLRLFSLEGVRKMFYRYARRLADRLDDLRTQAGMIIIRDEEDVDSEDYDVYLDSDSDGTYSTNADQ